MNDLISRQDVLKLVDSGYLISNGNYQKVRKMVESLPSAEPEIIRCRECKHSEHWYRDKLRCFLWHETGIDVFEDGFCNYAERRTDE